LLAGVGLRAAGGQFFEALERGEGLGVFGSEAGAADPGGVGEGLLGGVEVTALELQDAEVVEAAGGLRVVLAEAEAADLQGALVEGEGEAEVTVGDVDSRRCC
jgi:hypothetical protein